MPYRGDYRRRRGDYPRGDPGLFGFLGGLAKKALGFIPGIGPALSVGSAVVPALLHKREQQVASGQLQPNWVGRHLLPHLASTAPIGSSLAATSHGKVHRLLTSGDAGGMGGRRRRRMNWANPHALARAERRIHSAVKHFSRYIRWVHPKREGHAAPKFGKHRGKK